MEKSLGKKTSNGWFEVKKVETPEGVFFITIWAPEGGVQPEIPDNWTPINGDYPEKIRRILQENPSDSQLETALFHLQYDAMLTDRDPEAVKEIVLYPDPRVQKYLLTLIGYEGGLFEDASKGVALDPFRMGEEWLEILSLVLEWFRRLAEIQFKKREIWGEFSELPDMSKEGDATVSLS